MILGAGCYAAIYPRIKDGLLKKGSFGEITLPEALKVRPWPVVIIVCLIITAFLYGLEKLGW
jgi:hypothetical protein